MAKKRKDAKNESSNEIPANWNNPFVGLKIDFPKEEPPPPPPPPSPQELKREKLSKEDLELLKAFGDDVSAPAVGKADQEPSQEKSRGKVSFNIQRKGKGGKTVTLVYGLADLELTEQMEICGKVKTALGCGACFDNGILQIQGDQRQRAQEWFAKQGFRTV